VRIFGLWVCTGLIYLSESGYPGFEDLWLTPRFAIRMRFRKIENCYFRIIISRVILIKNTYTKTMNQLLEQAFAVVSQLPEQEQNEIAQIIFQKIVQNQQLLQPKYMDKNIDFMQFAGIANSEESILLQQLEHEIEEQRLLDSSREIEL
jgi:hypothetical protein